MRVILTGGGTAGHISPAIAISEEIMRREPKSEILFVGREGGAENDAVIRAGYPLRTVKICGLSRRVSLENIKNLFLALKSLSAAGRIISDFSPDAVIGTGGYVCWPMLKSAQKRGIPTVIHESNATAGLSTRLVADGCERVFLNFPECASTLKRQENISVVGNPVRTDFSRINRTQARRRLGASADSFVIVSFGGSGGAKRLNEAILSLIEDYSTKKRGIYHLHASGRKYYDAITKEAQTLTEGTHSAKIVPYIDNMAEALTAADLVISRSGAMTLSEIAESGTPAILIPSPTVTDNHQYKNALVFAERGAAVIIEEADLSAQTLIHEIEKLRKNRALRLRMQSELETLKTPLASSKIYGEIREMLGKITLRQ